MRLLDHASIGVPDLDAARPFYDAIMDALGARKVYDRPDAIGYGERCSSADTESTCLAIYLDRGDGALPGMDVRSGMRHWCFKAGHREQVDAFHREGVAAGGRCDGGPGIRPRYHEHYYAAFLVDPAGNRVEAVCHASPQA